MTKSRIGALVGAAVLTVAACTTTPGTPSGSAGGGDTSKGTIKIAFELPMQGSDRAGSQPVINGARLALKEHGGAAGGYAVVADDALVFDDSLNGKFDPQTGAQNMTTIIGDADIMAVLGPMNSSVARAQIPISNEAGLLQCSPANTNEGLTKPEFGALEIRKARPNDINYVRLATTDDYQGPAAAAYAFTTLGKKNVYIIDDTTTFGDGIADNFQKEFEKLGGTVVGRDGMPPDTENYTDVLTTAKSKNPDVIYFGGVTGNGGARIGLTLAQTGLGDIPFIGPDGIYDGGADTPDSFLNLVGDDAKNALATAAGAGDYPGKADFDAKYKAEYGIDATGYAGQGHGCMTVFLDAIERAVATNPADKAALREAIRKAGSDPTHTYQSVLGEFTFDANGDTSQKIISIYEYDPTTKAWKFKEQIDYAAVGG
jgi:branched-chain amino acid transport system substrate-binding protein